MQEKSICFSTDTPLVCVTHSAAVPRLKAIGELWSTLSYSVIFSFVTLCFILIPLVPSWYFLLKQPKTDKVLYDFTQTGVWFHWFTYWLRESRILTRYIFFLLCPVSICSLLSFSGCRWVYLLRQQVCVLVASHTCTQYWWCMEESELQ